MIGWALTFLALAIVATIFGFTDLAGTNAWILKLLFVVGLIAFTVFLFLNPSTPRRDK